MKRHRITIGKKNCLNDVPVLLNNSLPNITDLLKRDFEKGDFEGLKKTMKRFSMVFNDLDDMIDELQKKKKLVDIDDGN